MKKNNVVFWRLLVKFCDDMSAHKFIIMKFIRLATKYLKVSTYLYQNPWIIVFIPKLYITPCITNWPIYERELLFRYPELSIILLTVIWRIYRNFVILYCVRTHIILFVRRCLFWIFISHRKIKMMIYFDELS